MIKLFFVLIIVFSVISYLRNKGKYDEVILDSQSTLIDVRTSAEYNDGHLKNALNIPHTEIKEKISQYVSSKDQRIIVYCRSGRRSEIAKDVLNSMGYENVLNGGAYATLKRQEAVLQK